MRTWRSTTLVVALLIVLSGCSSADDADSGSDGTQTASSERTNGDPGIVTEMDANFDIGTLPADFPDILVPDSFTAGMYAELGTLRNANFESSLSFDDVVAEYTDRIGDEPTIVEGEERLASWIVDIWVVSVIEGPPTIIGVGTAE
ncbi:MAG: hypothetical protein RI637_08125 [Acidimicrobiia bacterium]|nr:hypothetical protein [Acidimicrobiia bacterium]